MTDIDTIQSIATSGPLTGALRAYPGFWLRLVSATLGTYTSTAAATETGQVAFATPRPAGIYELWTSPNGGDWTDTGLQYQVFASSLASQILSGDWRFESGRPWIDPGDPTGGTDSTLAINGKVAASVYIKLSPGTFDVSSIVIPSGATYIRLAGSGRGVTTLVCNTSGAKVIDVFAPVVTIEDMTINGNGLASYGIYLEDNAYYWKIKNVWVTGCTVSPGIGIANANHAYSGSAEHVVCTANTIGAKFVGFCQNTTLSHFQSLNNTSKNLVVGDGVTFVNDFHITDNSQLENDAGAGVYNLELNRADVDFDGYCESHGSSSSADIHITGSNFSILRASYYSALSLANYSVVIDSTATLYGTFEKCDTAGYAIGFLIDNNPSSTSVIEKTMCLEAGSIVDHTIARASNDIIEFPSGPAIPFAVANGGNVQMQVGSTTDTNGSGPLFFVSGTPANGTSLGFNAYYSGGAWKYARTLAAAVWSWDPTNGWQAQTAAAGTAGTAITFSNTYKFATKYTVSITPTSVAATTIAEQTFTVTGVATGQVIVVSSPSAQTAGIGIVGCRVSAANTVAIAFHNITAGAVTPAAGSYVFMAL